MHFDDFAIRRVGVLLSLIGIVLLFFLSELDRPMQISVGEIGEQHLSKKIITIGTVHNRFYTKNTLLFELRDNTKIKAVLFAPNPEQLEEVQNNALLLVEGTVKEYKGEIEIVVERLRKVD